ncbi:hypothetical protein AX774_g4639, partial [Zancudomyces culisetae]
MLSSTQAKLLGEQHTASQTPNNHRYLGCSS